MAVNRTIQFKRNQTLSLNQSEAKQRIAAIESQLSNGEFVINTYMDTNARERQASVLGIKAFNKLFFIDNQVILNKLGINDDGTINENITDSIEKTIEKIITACGLESDGDYIVDTTDKFLSGATSLADADSKLSNELQAVEDYIGMGGGGGSLLDKIETLSGKSITQVEDTSTVDFTMSNADDGTKKIKADVKTSSQSGNDIQTKNDGLYMSVGYNAVTNALIVNGQETKFNVGSLLDSAKYDPDTEQIILYYTNASGRTEEVDIPVAGLIEEYDFKAADANHNVGFVMTRSVSGDTIIQADVQNFDCGEYD